MDLGFISRNDRIAKSRFLEIPGRALAKLCVQSLLPRSAGTTEARFEAESLSQNISLDLLIKNYMRYAHHIHI